MDAYASNRPVDDDPVTAVPGGLVVVVVEPVGTVVEVVEVVEVVLVVVVVELVVVVTRLRWHITTPVKFHSAVVPGGNS